MFFLTLMKVLPGRVSDQHGFLKRISAVPPPAGVNIKGVYFLFGRYNGAILFEAPDLKKAKDFILRIAAPSVYETETLIAIPAEEL